MYKGLWKLIKRTTQEESSVAIYLVVNILCWTALTIVLGLAGTALMQKSLIESLTNITCLGVYAGILFGLVGGVVYLQFGSGNRDL